MTCVFEQTMYLRLREPEIAIFAEKRCYLLYFGVLLENGIEKLLIITNTKLRSSEIRKKLMSNLLNQLLICCWFIFSSCCLMLNSVRLLKHLFIHKTESNNHFVSNT